MTKAQPLLKTRNDIDRPCTPSDCSSSATEKSLTRLGSKT